METDLVNQSTNLRVWKFKSIKENQNNNNYSNQQLSLQSDTTKQSSKRSCFRKMDDYNERKKKLFWLSLVFYFNNMLSIFLTIKYFNAEQYLYFIIFWTLFGLDKLISLLIMLSQRDSLVFWLFDVLQLGWIYIYFTKYLPFGHDGIIATKLFTRVLPFVVSETILLFGFGLISGDFIIESYVVLLTYLNFFVFLLLAIFLLATFDGGKTFTKNFIQVIATYTIQASLLGLKDSFGVKIGYYTLGVGAILIIIALLHVPRYSIVDFGCIMSFSLCAIYQLAITSLFNPDRWYEIKMMSIQYYISQYIRFALLIIFGIPFLQQDFTSISFKEIIEVVNLAIGLLFGLIWIVYTAKDFYTNVFSLRCISFKFTDPDSYKKQLKKIPSRYRSLKQLRVRYENENYQDSERLLNGICNFECELSFQFFEKLSKLHKQDVTIDIVAHPAICNFHNIQIISGIQNVENRLLNQFSHSIQGSDDDFLLVNQIIMERYSNGFLCCGDLNLANTILNQILATKFMGYRQLEYRQKKPDMIGQTHSVLAFYKHISFFMPILPSQILYDLFEFTELQQPI